MTTSLNPEIHFTNHHSWPMAKRLGTFWDYIFSRENKPFKLFFSGSRTAK